MPVRQDLRSRWAKLVAMDWRELFDRVRQENCKRLDASLAHLGYEFAAGELNAGPARQPRFFFQPEGVPALISALRERLPQQAELIVRQAEKICRHRFDLMGYEDLDCGEEIDWHCDHVHGKRAPRKPFYQIRYLDFEEVGDSKVTWELNRHQHFVTLAKAYWLTGEEKFPAEIFRQWRHWHAVNPYPIGINWVSSLEVAFRSLSWLWMYFLLARSAVMPAGFHQQWLRAQALNGRHINRYLSTFFSPNTHLLGEAVALFFLGTLCPELRSSNDWKQRGWEIVLHESGRQVRADGFHFEQSTYYHVYALDFFLHAAILASVNGLTLPAEFEHTLEKMLDALFVLSRPGLPPRFGDDDGGRVFDPARNCSEHLLDPLATGAVLFGRGDFKFITGGLREETLWLLGEQGVEEWDRVPTAPPKHESAALASSGIYIMPGRELTCQLVVDAGPLGALAAGHGHADALSICVNSKGRALLSDSGTFEYVGDGPERNLLRGTGAHNTLRIDGADQSDVRGPFSWMHLPSAKAEVWIQGETFDLFVGSHDGFTRLAQPVMHQRWIFSLKGNFWVVRDLAVGEGQHRLEISWHLGPEMQLQQGNIVGVRNGEDQLAILTVEGHGWSQEGHKDWWSPCYGRKQPNMVLNFSTVARLPAEFVTLLVPLEVGTTDVGKIICDPSKNREESVKGYRCTTPDARHGFFFGKAGESWKSEAWASDAEFLYWAMDRHNQVRHLIFCNGSWVDVDDKRLVMCERKVSRCELLLEETGFNILSSSDQESVSVQDPLSILTVHAAAVLPNGDAVVPDMAK
jgi:Heparinase II/III-like protein/Heparinase II/III N-terminus